jgi:bacterioferritin-associated ferredoxin
MYVCLCNGFTDSKVRMIARKRNCSVADVYRSLGVTPKCCKCVPMIRSILDSETPREENLERAA